MLRLKTEMSNIKSREFLIVYWGENFKGSTEILQDLIKDYERNSPLASLVSLICEC